MKILAALSLVLVSKVAIAAPIRLECRVLENGKLKLEKVVELKAGEATIADTDQFLIQIKTEDERLFSLSALDRFEEMRTYAEAIIATEDNRIGLAIWKRSGLLEVDCRRQTLRRRF